jgi:endoglucanase
MRLPAWCAALLLGVSGVAALTASPAHATPVRTAAAAQAAAAARPGGAPQLHVRGNELVGADGRPVVLHGVDRSGTEYMCVQDRGIFDGPADQASITAMKSWHVNAVRVPLNEACLNAESYVDPAYAGVTYLRAIQSYVRLLNANGIVAILDLHWTDGLYTGPSAGCSSAQAVCQKPMPDAAQSIPFWRTIAKAFRGNDAVIFDLFNEPYPERADNGNETEGWQCWRDGGSCAGISYPVAGMQTLVDTIRATGAGNVIMLGGLAYANDLTGWLRYMPHDPRHNLAASWHSYNFNACDTQSCWDSQIAPVIARVPLLAGEIGENDCAGTYIDPLMNWLDSKRTGYLAWTWDDWSGACATGPVLITGYNGDPTPYGAAYRAHLAKLAAGRR